MRVLYVLHVSREEHGCHSHLRLYALKATQRMAPAPKERVQVLPAVPLRHLLTPNIFFILTWKLERLEEGMDTILLEKPVHSRNIPRKRRLLNALP